MEHSLTKIALDLLSKGPHKLEQTPRRVRALYDTVWIFDTTSARHVWEHPWYPQYYIPTSAVKSGLLTKNDAVDKEGSAFLATLKGKSESMDRVLVFEKGKLAGLVRFEFGAMGKWKGDFKCEGKGGVNDVNAADMWFEEDQPIYGHPKDPYKRIDILPSSRKVTVKIDGTLVAESSNNMFLFETGLRARFYLPKPAVSWSSEQFVARLILTDTI